MNLIKNKKAVLEDLIKIILWIIFFIIALLGVYYLIKRVGV
ncbi:MAG: hypothetical protein AABX77_02855 [Nanoarchaeota archaeon]